MSTDSNTPATDNAGIQVPHSEIQAPQYFDLIEWRRAKVIEYLGMGKTQRAIAEILKVSESLISLDVKHLRQEAKEKHGEYIDNLPMRHKVRVAAMDKAIAELWSLYEKETDNRTRKGILDSIKDALLAQAQLDGDPAAIERALKATARIKKQIAEVAEQTA